MFYKLRNRLLLLLMATVTVLTALFFFAIAVSMYQATDRQNNEMLDRGFDVQGAAPDENGALRDRLSPVFSVDIAGDGVIGAVYSSFNMDTGFYDALVSAAVGKNSGTGIISYDNATFKFKTFVLDSGYRIVFLDVSRDIQSILSMVYSLLWISLPLGGSVCAESTYEGMTTFTVSLPFA